MCGLWSIGLCTTIVRIFETMRGNEGTQTMSLMSATKCCTRIIVFWQHKLLVAKCVGHWYVCSRSAREESCTTIVRGTVTVSAVRTVNGFLVVNGSRPLTTSRTVSTATVNCLPRDAPPVQNQSQVR